MTPEKLEQLVETWLRHCAANPGPSQMQEQSVELLLSTGPDCREFAAGVLAGLESAMFTIDYADDNPEAMRALGSFVGCLAQYVPATMLCKQVVPGAPIASLSYDKLERTGTHQG